MLEPTLLPMDKWVMNTEAHPLPVLQTPVRTNAAHAGGDHVEPGLSTL